jgi:hypothetical protein
MLFDYKKYSTMSTKAWFAYGGVGSVLLPENYLLSGDFPRCRYGFTICAIYADNIGLEFPGTLSTNLRRYIADGLTNGIPEPRLPLGAVKYLYMKSV